MNHEELYSSLIGIFAYDMGSVGSGIHDERLRARLIAHVRSLSSAEHAELLSKIVWDAALSPDARGEGYTPEDAYEFLKWCDDQGILIS